MSGLIHQRGSQVGEGSIAAGPSPREEDAARRRETSSSSPLRTTCSQVVFLDVVFEHRSEPPVGPVRKSAHPSRWRSTHSDTRTYRTAERQLMDRTRPGKKSSPCRRDRSSSTTRMIFPPAAGRDVPRKDHDLLHRAVRPGDDAPLGFDVPDVAIPVHQPVFHPAPGPRGDGLFKYPLHLVTIVRMHVHERARPLQRVRFFQKTFV